MKRILSVLLLAVMLFSLCACGNDDNNEAPGKEETGLQTSAKDFIAALQQNTGAKTADKLLGTGDDDYESLLSMYLGVEPALISDGAMA
ncbi:MAG: hypothetical protein HUJ66_03875, partial [Oscillospiraceae bacterium]|nr:hypothetical protein [Oscillospiraceae bacterium]